MMERSGRKWLLVLFAVLSALAIFKYTSSEQNNGAILGIPSFRRKTALVEGSHFEILEGAEVAWMRPKGTPVGVLFLFHGCQHSGIDFFILPEERIIVTEALERNLFLIAFSSQNRNGNQCWDGKHPLGINSDWNGFQKTLKVFLARESLSQLPFFGFGASSGGQFVSLLPSKIPFEAIMIQISTGSRPVVNEYKPEMIKKVFFSTMIRDQKTTEICRKLGSKLQNKGIATRVYEVLPRQITPTYFSDFIDGVTEQDSKKIFDIFRENKFLGKTQTGETFLALDPRRNRQIMKSIDEIASFQKDQFEEELNILWGEHELTSADCKDWLREMLAEVTKKEETNQSNQQNI